MDDDKDSLLAAFLEAQDYEQFILKPFRVSFIPGVLVEFPDMLDHWVLVAVLAFDIQSFMLGVVSPVAFRANVTKEVESPR